ncbi:Auxin-responsive protein SAUR77 [Linum grandiflorum]
MKKINLLLRKCKSLSKQLGRSSSYSSLRSSKNDHHQLWRSQSSILDDDRRIVFVGSTRKRYVISSKCLSHPVVNALIDKSSISQDDGGDSDRTAVVKCEVVLFDHLLWMLDNAEITDGDLSIESLQELADLYVF